MQVIEAVEVSVGFTLHPSLAHTPPYTYLFTTGGSLKPVAIPPR